MSTGSSGIWFEGFSLEIRGLLLRIWLVGMKLLEGMIFLGRDS